MDVSFCKESGTVLITRASMVSKPKFWRTYTENFSKRILRFLTVSFHILVLMAVWASHWGKNKKYLADYSSHLWISVLCFETRPTPPQMNVSLYCCFIFLSPDTYSSRVRRQTSCSYEGSQGVNYSQTKLPWKTVSHFSCSVENTSLNPGRFPRQLGVWWFTEG